MPTYLVTDNETGTELELTGDSPPTDVELEEIFANYSKEQGVKAQASAYGDVRSQFIESPTVEDVNKTMPYQSTWDSVSSALQNIPEDFMQQYYGLKIAESETSIERLKEKVTDLESRGIKQSSAHYLLSEYGKELPQEFKDLTESQKERKPVFVEPGSVSYYASAATSSMGNTLPAVVAGVFMGPEVSLTMFYAQAKGRAYLEGRDAGLTPEIANDYATYTGLAEALPELLPLHFILKPGAKFFSRVLKGAAAEVVQEEITELLQIGLDKGYINEDMTWAEARQRLVDAGILATVIGPAQAAIAHPLVKAKEMMTGGAVELSKELADGPRVKMDGGPVEFAENSAQEAMQEAVIDSESIDKEYSDLPPMLQEQSGITDEMVEDKDYGAPTIFGEQAGPAEPDITDMTGTPKMLQEQAGLGPEETDTPAIFKDQAGPADTLQSETPSTEKAEIEKPVIKYIDNEKRGVIPKIKRWVRRNLTKEGLLNTQAFEAKLQKDAAKNVGEHDLSDMVYDFEGSMKAAFGKRYNKIDLKDLENVNKYLSGDKNVKLPRRLVKNIDHMRAYLDRLSTGMERTMLDMATIEAQKAGMSLNDAMNMENPPEIVQKHIQLFNTIKNNKGTYLTRSYQAFDDINWKDKALNNKEIFSNAAEVIAEQNPELNEQEIIGAVRAILQSAKENGNFISFMTNGTKVGSKDVSLLTKRKDIHPAIKALLGEYKDPKVNFTRSANKMQYFIANHNFLMSLRSQGLGVFLFEKPTGNFDSQVATKGSEAMNPLNGLYTTADMKQGLEDASGGYESSEIMRNIVRLNSMVKYGKTILSPSTQARNFQSAAMFSIMNGHFNWLHSAKAFKVAKADLFTKDREWRRYIRKLISMGVIHDNPFAGEIRDAIDDFIEINEYKKGAMQGPKKLLSFMQRTYQIGDDFWKVIGFENEVKLQMDNGLSREKAEEKAAYRIRNGYPTYSMVPEGVKKVRRWPLIGTFVSFPYEIVRTSANQLRFIKEDLADGNNKSAAYRVLGLSIATSAAYAASIASMMALGISDEDDEAVRKVLPEWSRNSQLIYYGYDKNGMPLYYDISYIDPYTYLKKPISAILNGNNEGLDDKILDAGVEFLEPFVGVDIAAGALLEIVSNKKSSGAPVYNEQADSWEKAKSILNHSRKAVQPGAFLNMERMILALNSETTRSGRQYKVSDELLALIGHRFGTLNIPQSTVYKSYQFMDDKNDSSTLLNYVVGSGEKISEEQVRKAASQMKKARENVYKDMIKYIKAGKQLNVDEGTLYLIMTSSGISEKDAAFIIDGTIPEWTMPEGYMIKGLTRSILTAIDDERRAEVEKEYEKRITTIGEILSEE